MKVFRVLLSDRAETDLLVQHFRIAQFSNETIADRFLDRLETAVSSLSYFPERGVPRDTVAPGARILIEGNYLIIYGVENDTVQVMRIVHGAIDLTRLFS